jgi:hypothetical protein
MITSCDPAIYLNLRTSDDRFENIHTKQKEFLVYESDRIEIKINGAIRVGWFEKEKEGTIVGFDIYLFSKEDFVFDLSQCFILDSLNQKLLPHYHSIYRKDNRYKANKKYELAAVFMSGYYEGKGYFTLPLFLSIPPIFFESDSIFFPTVRAN